MTTKYVIHKSSGKVSLETCEECEVEEHQEVIVDPPVAEGTDLGGDLIYKDGVLRNMTPEDKAECQEAQQSFCHARSIVGAKKFMDPTVTSDTMVSASALIEVIHDQLSLLEQEQPIQTFEEMMAEYENKVDNWSDIEDTLRFC